MTASETREARRQPARSARGRPYKNVPDTRGMSMLGIGMMVGAVIGAGIALLVAPQSGAQTRRGLTRRAENIRGGRGVWTRLGREFQRAAAAKKKSAEIEAKREEIAAREGGTGAEPV